MGKPSDGTLGTFIKSKKGIALIIVSALIILAIIGGIANGGSNKTQVSQNMAGSVSAQTETAKESASEEKIETKTEAIPFTSTNENDATLAQGQTKIKQAGVNGAKEIKYRVTVVDAKETKREKISEVVTVQIIPRIILVGTYVAPTPPPVQPQPEPQANCDPNYSGACVPIASDVDCAGGSGNGPAYVSGPVYVIGTDKYGLDRDGDGVGCE